MPINPLTGVNEPAPTGLIGGRAPTAAPSTSAPYKAPPVFTGAGQVKQVETSLLGDAKQWNVADNQTVAGQVRGLIAGNDQIQQLEETQAKQAMNQSGLINTSMTAGAIQDARYRAALPIAQADAQTFGRAAEYNTRTGNEFSVENVRNLGTDRRFNVESDNLQMRDDLSAQNTARRDDVQAGVNRDTAATLAQTNAATDQIRIQADKDTAAGLKNTNAQTAAKLAETNKETATALSKIDQLLLTSKQEFDTKTTQTAAGVAVGTQLNIDIGNINARTDIDGTAKAVHIKAAISSANANLNFINVADGLTADILYFGQNEVGGLVGVGADQASQEAARTPTPTPPTVDSSGNDNGFGKVRNGFGKGRGGSFGYGENAMGTPYDANGNLRYEG